MDAGQLYSASTAIFPASFRRRQAAFHSFIYYFIMLDYFHFAASTMPRSAMNMPILLARFFFALPATMDAAMMTCCFFRCYLEHCAWHCLSRASAIFHAYMPDAARRFAERPFRAELLANFADFSSRLIRLSLFRRLPSMPLCRSAWLVLRFVGGAGARPGGRTLPIRQHFGFSVAGIAAGAPADRADWRATLGSR